MHVLDTINDIRRSEEFFANKNNFTTGPVEVSKKLTQGDPMVIIDLREVGDFRAGHVPGAVNLPEDRWPTLRGLSKSVPNILYCYSQTCHLASRAAQYFAHQGYPVMEMDGGFEAWQGNKLKVEK